MRAAQSILIGGGARSGKSAFALARARQLGVRRICVATARPVDDEMQARIARHRRDRGADFETIEEPLELPATLRMLAGVDVVVVDCLTFWVSNLLLRGDDEMHILSEVEVFADVVREVAFHTLVVTNEVGMSVHPEHALGRTFRDLVGRAHQRLARNADEIYFAALGVIVRLRPGPVAIESPVNPV
jgi:adenosylcobinamide kinase / adenosylcobinamide-phosphate guanylyltransferase